MVFNDIKLNFTLADPLFLLDACHFYLFYVLE